MILAQKLMDAARNLHVLLFQSELSDENSVVTDVINCVTGRKAPDRTANSHHFKYKNVSPLLNLFKRKR